MNKGHSILLAGSVYLLAASTVRANIIFSQDFTSSANIADYANLANPNSGQWNAISGGIITGDTPAARALAFTRGSSGSGMFTRSTDFSPTPQAMIYQFDVTLSAYTVAAKPAAVFQVGSGFSTTSGPEANANVHSQFGLNIYDTHGGYNFRDLKTTTDFPSSGSFSGTSHITWVINNSSAPISYTTPNSTTATLGVDQWDLWLNRDPVFSGRSATTPGQSLTDAKFSFTAGQGTLTLDNFSIASVDCVPEPALTGTLAVGFLGLVISVAAFVRTRDPSDP
jgi:hypothetical protein